MSGVSNLSSRNVNLSLNPTSVAAKSPLTDHPAQGSPAPPAGNNKIENLIETIKQFKPKPLKGLGRSAGLKLNILAW